LRPAASTHGGTKLGVAPPGERPSTPHPVVARSTTQAGAGSRTWLIVGLVLVAVSALALVLVLVQ